MADAVELAHQLELESIVIEADEIERYAWLRCGFVPDRGSWREMQTAIIRKLVEVKDHLGADRWMELVQMAQSARLEVAREFASLTDPVPSAFFSEAASRWSGSLRLNDRTSTDILAGYVGT